MKGFDVEFDVPQKQLLPVIIGCSSEIITSDLEDQCDREGFQLLCNSPMTVTDLRQAVFPLVYQRQKKLIVNNLDYMCLSQISNHSLNKKAKRKESSLGLI